MYLDLGTPWQGAAVAVLASGPSMSQAIADSVKHLPRIAINTTYQLAPDADYIYAADPLWWLENPEVLKCPGIKVSIQSRNSIRSNVPPEVVQMRYGGQSGFDERPGYLRTGGSSGYQALHLAASLGATRILLFGFDCHGGHWHGTHPSPLGNPTAWTYSGWIKAFNALAPILAARRVEVINCARGSRLNCFPFSSLDVIPLAA